MKPRRKEPVLVFRDRTPRDYADMLVNAGHFTPAEGDIIASGELTTPAKLPAWWDRIIPKVRNFSSDDGDD